MKWLYHTGNVWNSPADRTDWGEVYLQPADALAETEAIWLSIDALGDPSSCEEGDATLMKLGDADWHIDGTDMFVRAFDFNLDELLAWVRIWLSESDFECSQLVHVPFERIDIDWIATLETRMRERLQPLPKIAKTVPIPPELVAFLRYVHEMVESGDQSATVPSRDLLRTGHAYGGLIKSGGDRYQLWYFPERGSIRVWPLEFDVCEVADIANGDKTEMSVWECSAPECRWLCSDPSELCCVCDYSR